MKTDPTPAAAAQKGLETPVLHHTPAQETVQTIIKVRRRISGPIGNIQLFHVYTLILTTANHSLLSDWLLYFRPVQPTYTLMMERTVEDQYYGTSGYYR